VTPITPDASSESLSGHQVLDFADLETRLPKLAESYRAAEPFPHIVFDEFLDPDIARAAAAEFDPPDSDEWNSFVHVNERKYSNTAPETWGSASRSILDVLQSDRFVKFLTDLTGIEDLLRDDALEGGGLHQSRRGGFLNVHADYTVHPKHRHWRRRVNVLVYLNPEWRDEYGGELELWSRDMKHKVESVAPTCNRAVIFTTDMDSFHGHPDPLQCPEDLARRSLALYYFTEETAPVVRSTEYRSRPGEGWRAVPIYLDKQLLRGYDWTKRRIGLSDEATSKVLRRIDRLRRRGRSS